MSAELLVPVGRPGGLFDGSYGLVRRGAAAIRLDADSYAIWRVTAAARSRADIEKWALDKGLSEPTSTIHELVQVGLILATPLRREVVTDHCLSLVGELLGTHPAGARHGFAVRGRTNQVLGVGGAVYEALLRSGPFTTMAAVAAIVEASAGVDAIAPILAAIPRLIAAEVALLDAATI